MRSTSRKLHSTAQAGASDEDTLRCGLFSPSWPPQEASNGIVTYVAALESQLRELGHRATIITSNLSRSSMPLGSECDILECNSKAGRAQQIVDRLRYRLSRHPQEYMMKRNARMIGQTISRACRIHPVDILEMEESFGLSSFISSHVTAPIVVRLHGPWFLNGQALGIRKDDNFHRRVAQEGKAIANAFAVTACSQNVLEATRDFYRLELPHAVVIPNPAPGGVTGLQWSSGRADHNAILFVGRFDKHKGGDTVLLAFEQVVAEHPSAELLFVGPDRGILSGDGSSIHFKEFIKARLSEAACARVRYLGCQTPREIIQLRKNSGLTVIASSFDNFPYTALESVASGCPVVATRVGGIPEIVSHEQTGLLVDSDNPTALAKGILTLLKNREFATRLGAAAARDATERFHPRSIAQRTLDNYRDVISRWETRR